MLAVRAADTSGMKAAYEFLLVIVNVLCAALVAFAALFAYALQCDDGCTGTDWRTTAGAPQWTVILVAGLLSFGAACVTFASWKSIRVRAGATSAELAFMAAFCALATDSYGWLILVAAGASGLGALYLQVRAVA
jgi:hypothetical protein